MTQQWSPQQWAREADRYQRISEARRARVRRARWVARLEWALIILLIAAIFVALGLDVRL